MERDLICVWLRYIKLQKESKGIKSYHHLQRQIIDIVTRYKICRYSMILILNLSACLAFINFVFEGKARKPQGLFFIDFLQCSFYYNYLRRGKNRLHTRHTYLLKEIYRHWIKTEKGNTNLILFKCQNRKLFFLLLIKRMNFDDFVD